MEKYIIENGIKYELRSEQYYPIFSETNATEHHIGNTDRFTATTSSSTKEVHTPLS